MTGIEAEFLDLDQAIPDRMPILDRWVEKHRVQQPLAGVTALFIQHQLGNQIPQVRALIELGLDPLSIYWLDIPYTSNERVREALSGLGIPRRNMFVASDYKVLDAYAPYQRRRAQSVLRQLFADPPERLLVLDDGAYFLEAAACFNARLPRVAVVEQTARGLIKLKKNAAMRHYAQSLPVVNVARSRPKTALEPPFIARAVCSALWKRLRDQSAQRPTDRCLILGFGAIGSQVARFAVEYLGFQPTAVHVFDPSHTRLREATKLGYSVWNRRDVSHRFQLVIGCSGVASFSVYDFVYLEDGARLASASSGSVELSREDFIELAESTSFDDVRIVRDGVDPMNIHTDLEFELVGRTVTFINAGFPVNFDGRVNCVPTRYMQPTATMMVAASVQAMSCSRKGLVDLNRRFCGWLDHEFKVELGEHAVGFSDLRKDTSMISMNCARSIRETV